MKLTCHELPERGAKEYRLEIRGYDLLSLKLDPFDMRLMSECEASESIADKLLMLEMLARRYEQQGVKEDSRG